MSSGPDEEAATAAQVVLAATPADDAGASTADRYDWQAAMAAADGLALYLDAIQDGELRADEDARIVCEHHEDWAVVRANAAELVSAKHREPSYSVFTTIAQLTGADGLAHLFGRWHALQELPSCRLVTTAGLGPGPPQGLEKAAANLRDLRLAGQDLAAVGEHAAAISGFAQALLRHAAGLPALWQSAGQDGTATPTGEQRAQVSRFLAVLSIEHGKPSRAHVGHAAPSMYCAPVLECLGHGAVSPVAVWEAVLALFRARMRAAGPTPGGALPAVLTSQPGALPPEAVAGRELAARIVTMADIDLAVRIAIAHPRGYLPLAPAPRISRVALKMAAGRCTDNSIERAEHLRLDYQRYWRARSSGDPAARAGQERLRRVLLRISDQATTAALALGGTAWGAELWQELQARVEAMPAGEWPDDLDTELRLGGICDLVSRCQVWFSDRFDIDTEMARLRASQGAAL